MIQVITAVATERSSHMAPVEVVRVVGDTMDQYTDKAELSCAICTLPDQTVQCPMIDEVAGATLTCTNGRSYASTCMLTCNSGHLYGFQVAVCLVSG